MTPNHVKSCAENWEEEFETFAMFPNTTNRTIAYDVYDMDDIKDFIRRLLPQSSCPHFIRPQEQAKCKHCSGEREKGVE